MKNKYIMKREINMHTVRALCIAYMKAKKRAKKEREIMVKNKYINLAINYGTTNALKRLKK